MNTKIFGRPRPDFGLLVGGVVVRHQMQLSLRPGAGDVFEEDEET